MEGHDNPTVRGDRALSPGNEDKLGFRDVAKQIAISLVDQASDDGLVIGIEGAWGSGKSSLLSLVEDELGQLPTHRPTVIKFQPWLIGNRDALITSLFGELSKRLDQVALDAGDATPISITRAKEAKEALRSFVSGLSKAGATIEFAGDASGIAPIKWIGQGLNALGKLAHKKQAPPQLSELKDGLTKSLRNLEHRFVITIDDVDRLEPNEVIEVLRLVRSVADLPNIIYLLCYDSDILAHSIKKAAKIKSGHSYLEKIVQMTVMVPKPEPFQLRQWFTDELRSIGSPKDENELSRLKAVIDHDGGRQLRTPRSVVRTLDAVRFFWPPLRKAGADLADLVWIQLIKDGNPSLYRWIEEYCGTTSAVSLGMARVEEAEVAQQLAELFATVPEDYFDDLVYRSHFSEQLPGVEIDYNEGGHKFTLFSQISDEKQDESIREKRLSSPDHYRLYFALSDPSHALTLENFDSIWAAAEISAEALGTALLQLQKEYATGSLTKTDLMLERIGSGAYAELSPEICQNMLLAFAQVMDEAYRQHPFDLFWFNSLWERAQKLISTFLPHLDPDDRATAIKTMFRDGAAIGWLTSLFRHETFAHGRYGDSPRPAGEWLFNDAELDQVTELILGRYRSLTASEILNSPSPLGLLFAWRQGGDEEGPRKLMEANIASDESLIETLEHLTSTISSSDRGEVRALKKGNLEPFMDYESVKERINSLRKDDNLGSRATRLSLAFDEGFA